MKYTALIFALKREKNWNEKITQRLLSTSIDKQPLPVKAPESGVRLLTYGNRCGPPICCKKKMEAIVFDPKNMTVTYRKDHPIPVIKHDDDVIVEIKYSGICGSDLHIFQGEFPIPKDRTVTPGHESYGIIHAVGKKTPFKVGQKVIIDPNCPCQVCEFCRTANYQFCTTPNYQGIFKNGGWAQYAVVSAKQLFTLPDGVTPEQAALTEPLSCLARGYQRASPVKIGDRILILGAGICGNLWATILHHLGHREVTVSETNPVRLKLAKNLGLGFRFITPDVMTKEKIFYDLIIDNTGVAKAMTISCKYLREGGKYLVFGCCPATDMTSVNPFEIFDKELTIIGVKMNPFCFPIALGWIKALGNKYPTYDKLGVKMYRLSEYKQALADLKKGNIGKALFKINQD